MRLLILLIASATVGACGGGSGGDCETQACACSATMPCPAGFECDPLTLTCVRTGTSADAAPAPDAPPLVGALTVTLYSTGTPVAFADVVVGAADGSMVASGKTNSAGTYTYPSFQEGMMVTAVVQSATLSVATVVTDLAPGTLVLGDPTTNTARTPVVVNLPSYGQATSYEVDNGCTRQPSTDLVFTLATRDACISASNQVRIVAYAVNAAAQRIAYSVTDSAYPPAGNIQAGAWKTDLSSVAISPSDIPATGAATVTFTARRSAVPRSVYASDALTLTGTTLQTIRFAPGAFDMGTTMFQHDAIVPPLRVVRSLSRGHVVGASGDIPEPVSFANDFLGAPLMPMLDRTNGARPVVTFGTPAPSYDMTLVRLVATRTTDPVTGYGFVFFVPPGRSSVQVPELPASLSAVTPMTADNIGDPAVVLVDVDTLPGYRAIVAQPFFLNLATGAPPAFGAPYATRVSSATTAPRLTPAKPRR